MNELKAPLTYLHTTGPAADPVTRLGWGLGLVSVAVVVIVTLLLIGAVWRRRHSSQDDTADAARGLMPVHEGKELRWVYVGTAISSVVLLACAAWTLSALAAIAVPAAAPGTVIEVRGFQYWWQVRYLDPKGNVMLTTANEIHLPQGQPVKVKLSSSDVIHSFWVPSLGGKMDAIPGQTNVTWLQGDQVGRFRGQCGEFCGAQHAHMGLYVSVDSPADYERWLQGQQQPASPVDAKEAMVAAGHQTFINQCAGCHAVRGTEAHGALGPDLTHLMTRQTLAAGTVPNQPAELRRWIEQPQQVKPGSAMPAVPLSADELNSVVTYLETLH